MDREIDKRQYIDRREIDQFLEQERKRQTRKERIIAGIGGTASLAGLLWMGSLAYEEFVTVPQRKKEAEDAYMQRIIADAQAKEAAWEREHRPTRLRTSLEDSVTEKFRALFSEKETAHYNPQTRETTISYLSSDAFYHIAISPDNLQAEIKLDSAYGVIDNVRLHFDENGGFDNITYRKNGYAGETRTLDDANLTDSEKNHFRLLIDDKLSPSNQTKFKTLIDFVRNQEQKYQREMKK